MDYAAAIRQQAEDLQEELKELDLWQEEVLRKQEANKKRKAQPTNADAIPPIRGTVPSLKEAVQKIAPKSNDEDPVKKTKDHGNELFQQGKIKEAVEAYSAGIDLDAEGPLAHVLYGNRALCYLKLDKWVDAERDASSCVRLNRSYSKGYYRRAVARRQLGNLKGARTDLEAVLALVPNDANATSEMKTITQMMQQERESTGAAVKKKKIVIAEVDEDEDDDDAGESAALKDNVKDEAHEAERSEQLRKAMEELEKAREVQRDLQHSKAKEQEAMLSQKRRTCGRVEVIEEEPVPVQSTEDSKSAAKVREVASKLPEEGQKTPSIVPRSLKTSSKWTKENLKAPKSFTEFERVFSDIKDDEELCCSFVSMIQPATLRTLFGNNMTPEILVGLLRAVKRLHGAVAIDFLKALCAVKRVEDISLFFDASEKKLVEEVLSVVVSFGASPEDVKIFKQRLKTV
ncbi:putative TPR-repeat protein [Trypanosoma grayi]|uniref:putative TPR-repeat protein n=1 Tax=Trypanosoma grayi TaxID=71804 RepID=UPI0004F48AD0|nr:putative TPR-repeat protein [Trypanosoma grayi]KEG10194.1 putative TPR-repeat protein [Trypanosoma grayi]